MSYWRLNEDPTYDEDGVLVDEDFEDIEQHLDEIEETK